MTEAEPDTPGHGAADDEDDHENRDDPAEHTGGEESDRRGRNDTEQQHGRQSTDRKHGVRELTKSTEESLHGADMKRTLYIAKRPQWVNVWRTFRP